MHGPFWLTVRCLMVLVLLEVSEQFGLMKVGLQYMTVITWVEAISFLLRNNRCPDEDCPVAVPLTKPSD